MTRRPPQPRRWCRVARSALGSGTWSICHPRRQIPWPHCARPSRACPFRWSSSHWRLQMPWVSSRRRTYWRRSPSSLCRPCRRRVRSPSSRANDVARDPVHVLARRAAHARVETQCDCAAVTGRGSSPSDRARVPHPRDMATMEAAGVASHASNPCLHLPRRRLRHHNLWLRLLCSPRRTRTTAL